MHNHKKIIIVLGFSLALFVMISIYTFIENRNLSKTLKTTKGEISMLEDSEIYQRIAKMDSLIFIGQYDLAKGIYDEKGGARDSDLEDAFHLRMNFIKSLERQQNRLAETDSSNTVIVDTVLQQTRATSAEIREYDSIQFALSKAQLQIQNLKKQIKEKQQGEYLVINFENGNKAHYVGKVEAEKANGRGVALFETGSRYEGEWKDNRRHGEGSFYWPDGEYYVGEYKNDKRAGKGTYYWPNGEKFTGEWANNQRNGKGTFYGKEGEIVAQGSWENDELTTVEQK